MRVKCGREQYQFSCVEKILLHYVSIREWFLDSFWLDLMTNLRLLGVSMGLDVELLLGNGFFFTKNYLKKKKLKIFQFGKSESKR